MNDDNSTFGKDYRVYYSLLAFNGTVNKYAAKTTGLTEEDQKLFRKAIWESIPSQPTRSKMNQYPKLYLEIIYNEGFNNGYFGDLRNTIKIDCKNGIAAKQVRSFSDLVIDVSALVSLLKENTGEGNPIKEVIINKSIDFPELKIN
jgi:CRISPR-associated protein Csh2